MRSLKHVVALIALFASSGAFAQVPPFKIKIRELPVCSSPADTDMAALSTVGGVTCSQTRAVLRSGFLSTTTAQAVNTFLAGPSSGGSAAPTFRAIVAGDVPDLWTTSQSANRVWASPSGSSGTPTFRAITAADLASGLVTYAKIQNVSTNNRLLGRSTAGAGTVEEITVGSGLTLSGGSLTASAGAGTVTSVGMTVPGSLLAVSPASITTSGTFAVSLSNAAANTFWMNNTGGSAAPSYVAQSSVLHNSFGGLTTGDPHTQYALITGRAVGQQIFGGSATGTNLVLTSNSVDTGANNGVFINGANSDILKQSTNQSQWRHGELSELLTVNATPKDTSAAILPANSIIRSVDVRVVSSLTGSCSALNIGDASSASRFASGLAVTSGSTVVGLTHVDQTGAAGPKQVSAASVRVTCASGSPSGGTVRITVWYDSFVPPAT